MQSLLARFVSHGARRLAVLATLPTLALLSGCLGSDKLTGTSNGGRFSATVTGDLQGTLLGGAEVVTLAPVTNGTTTTPGGVALGLIDVGGSILAFKWTGLSTLTTGTTTVGSDSTTTILTLQLPTSAGGNRYVGSGGTITIASVTPTTVTGSFDATAKSIDTANNIAITGTFTAVVVASGTR